jgi:WD40 repeat protein
VAATVVRTFASENVMNRLHLFTPVCLALTCAALPAEEPPRPKWLPSNEITLPKPGEPLSPQALVQSPAVLKDVAAWTVESRDHRSPVGAVAIRPDGAAIATSGKDGTIRIWNADTGALQLVLPAEKGTAEALAFSPDGRRLAVAGAETGDSDITALRIWRLGETARIVRRRVLPRSGNRIAWSPDGSLIVWQSHHEVPPAFFDWQENRMLKNAGIVGVISDRPWSSDGKQFATTDDKGLHIWDFERQQLLDTIAGEHLSNAQWSRDADYLAVSRGRVIVFNSGPRDRGGTTERRVTDGQVEFWHVRERQLVNSLQAASSFSWSPDGFHVTDWTRNTARLLDVASGKVREIPQLAGEAKPSKRGWTWYPPESTFYARGGNHWSADGARLTSIFHDQVWLTDIKSGQTRRMGGFDDRLTLPSSSLLRNRLTALLHHPNSAKRLTILDLERFQPQSIGPLEVENTWFPSISPTGEIIALVQAVGTDPSPLDHWTRETRLSFLETVSGKQWGEVSLTCPQRGFESEFPQLIWSPDGAHLAALDSSGMQVYEVRKAKPLSGFETEKHLQGGAAWSPDGRMLVTFDDKSAIVCEVASGKTLHRLKATVPHGFKRPSYGGSHGIRFGGRGIGGDYSPSPDHDDEVDNGGFTSATAFAWSSDGRSIAAVESGRFSPASEPSDSESDANPFGESKPPRKSWLHVWSRQDDGCKLLRQWEIPAPNVSDTERLRETRRRPTMAITPMADRIAVGTGEQILLFDLGSKADKNSRREVTTEIAGWLTSLRWLGGDRLMYTAGVEPFSNEYGVIDAGTGKELVHLRAMGNASLATDGRSVAVVQGSQFELLDALDGARLASLVPLAPAEGKGDFSWLAVDPRGYYKTTAGAKDQVVFVVLQSDGEYRTLPPEQFQRLYGWKNDPQHVRLTP